jgi:hypothetical protein
MVCGMAGSSAAFMAAIAAAGFGGWCWWTVYSLQEEPQH